MCGRAIKMAGAKMASFRPTKDQAKYLVGKKTCLGVSRHELKKLVDSDFDMPITSINTRNQYEYEIEGFLNHLKSQRIPVDKVCAEIAHDFVKLKSADCEQKTIDGYRQAINKVFCLNIPFVVSDLETVKNQRAYTNRQIDYLCSCAKPMLALSILIAATAGLRAVELDTICRPSDRREDLRDWLPERFYGKASDCRYVVHGKGGLRRTIVLPENLSCEIEKYRHDQPVTKISRKIAYTKYYDLIGGHSFSQQFTRLIKKHFGWSSGAHGLRHTFAQQRMQFLQISGFTYDFALEVLSQELGHFDIKNTLEYLR